MFNKKKIFSNHVRASQNKNKKAQKFLSMIYNILIDKCSSYNSIKSSDVILELAARNDVLINTLNSRRIFPYFYRTVLTSSVKIKNKNVVVSELENQTFLNSSLNKCFCILSINNSTKIPLVFQNVYNVLKEKGLTYKIFMHSWKTKDSNQRVWQHTIREKIDYDEYKLLPPSFSNEAGRWQKGTDTMDV